MNKLLTASLILPVCFLASADPVSTDLSSWTFDTKKGTATYTGRSVTAKSSDYGNVTSSHSYASDTFSVELAKFNSAAVASALGGSTTTFTLSSVVLEAKFNVAGTVGLHNDSTDTTSAQSGTVTLGGTRSFSLNLDNNKLTAEAQITTTQGFTSTLNGGQTTDPLKTFSLSEKQDSNTKGTPTDDLSGFIGESTTDKYTLNGTISYGTIAATLGADMQYSETDTTFYTYSITYAFTPVPEPGTASLAFTALLLLGLRRKRSV